MIYRIQNGIKRFMVEILIPILIGAFTVGTLIFILFIYSEYKKDVCKNKTDGLGYPMQYENIMAGCKIQVDGFWIPLENWKYITIGE